MHNLWINVRKTLQTPRLCNTESCCVGLGYCLRSSKDYSLLDAHKARLLPGSAPLPGFANVQLLIVFKQDSLLVCLIGMGRRAGQTDWKSKPRPYAADATPCPAAVHVVDGQCDFNHCSHTLCKYLGCMLPFNYTSLKAY